MATILAALALLATLLAAGAPGFSASAAARKQLAATPPMGWNDWAHYQCHFTAQTILENARELVKTGLAAHGYNTVTIDDCWMQKTRDAKGNLQADPGRFPDGMKPVAEAVHKLGLRFGIYEDAGFATCGGFAGSGEPRGGGKAHFAQDARLFASWGVDYLKLDGCNVYVPPGSNANTAYRKAYATESSALKSSGRSIVFSESAPAYFQGTPEWYDVLNWVRDYGQLWREGSDVAIYWGNRRPRRHFRFPRPTRFQSVLWNYSYNLPLGRFQKPGNWNDADFIIGGDSGVTLAESRSQLALWSMMSAPLILSSNVSKLSPQAIAILGDKAVIAVDQDPLGRMATLVSRSASTDVLFKPLANGDDVLAVLNHSTAPISVVLSPSDFGFNASGECRLVAHNLWTGAGPFEVSAIHVRVASNDTAIWRVRASAACERPSRTGAIVTTHNVRFHRGEGDFWRFRSPENYTRCLSAPGSVETCTGAASERWTVTARGALRSSGGQCLAASSGKPALEACRPVSAQRWHYTLNGNLLSTAAHKCLTASGPDSGPQSLALQACGHNQPDQIWSLPN